MFLSVINISLLHKTALCNTVLDNAGKEREATKAELMSYLSSDTLL